MNFFSFIQDQELTVAMGENEKQCSTKYENVREYLRHMGAILTSAYILLNIYYLQNTMWDTGRQKA